MTLNVFGEVEWERERDRPGWNWKHLDVDGALGPGAIGASLYELQPGQRTFPYHWHVFQEEWLLVVSGEPTLRCADGEQMLIPGDVAVFPCGPGGGHSIRNDTSEPVRLLMLSSKAEAEIAVYPDSGKVGLFTEEFRTFLDMSAEVDYFAGEED